MKIERVSVRTQVRDHVLQRVLRGQIQAGERVNETALASQLGVSQTPVREALCGLAEQDLLLAKPGRGFVVAPFSRQEAEETFPILGALEAFALRKCGLPDTAALEELETLNEELGQSPAEQAMEIDERWHRCLLQRCTNERLRKMIAGLKRAVFRYDYAYMREDGHRSTSTGSHEEILKALRSRDLDAAAYWLERNWVDCLPALLGWLTKLEGSDSSSSRGSRRTQRRKS